MIYLSAAEIRSRAESLVARVGSLRGVHVEVIEGTSVIGGGTAPTTTLPTFLVAITSERHHCNELLTRLRSNCPPIVARIEGDRLVLDLRTVFTEEDNALTTALLGTLTQSSAG